MVLATPIEEDLVDDEGADDDLAIAPSSFFGDLDDELAGVAVCANVYRLYLRDSVERGYAERTASARELTRALSADAITRRQHLARAPRDFRPPAPTVVHRDVKPANLPSPPQPPAEVLVVAPSDGDGESGFRAALRAGHAHLAKRLGRVPNARELFEHMGEDNAKSPQNVRIGSKRAGLELASQRGGGERHTSVKPPARAPKRLLAVREPDEGDAPSPPSGGVGATLAIMALQSERARIQSQLDAVDAVIGRLSK